MSKTVRLLVVDPSTRRIEAFVSDDNGLTWFRLVNYGGCGSRDAGFCVARVPAAVDPRKWEQCWSN